MHELLIHSHSLICSPGLMCLFDPCRCCWWCQKSAAAPTQPSSCFHENRVGCMIMKNKGNETQSIASKCFVHSHLFSDYETFWLPHCSNCPYRRHFLVGLMNSFPQFQNSRIPPESVQVSTCSIHSGAAAGWWVGLIFSSRTKFPLSYSFKTGRPR